MFIFRHIIYLIMIFLLVTMTKHVFPPVQLVKDHLKSVKKNINKKSSRRGRKHSRVLLTRTLTFTEHVADYNASYNFLAKVIKHNSKPMNPLKLLMIIFCIWNTVFITKKKYTANTYICYTYT